MGDKWIVARRANPVPGRRTPASPTFDGIAQKRGATPESAAVRSTLWVLERGLGTGRCSHTSCGTLQSPELRAFLSPSRYTSSVRSVADEFRAETRASMARLSPGERVELALTLGDSDVTLLSAARRFSRDEAVQVIRVLRQHGRRRSASTERSLP